MHAAKTYRRARGTRESSFPFQRYSRDVADNFTRVSLEEGKRRKICKY